MERTALRLIAASPLASALVGALALEAGWSFEESAGLAVITLAIVWGFLGALSWLTARGVEATERALEQRKLLRSAVVDPQHGQLALRLSGELSETEAPSGTLGRRPSR